MAAHDPAVRAGLRLAFANELVERLPRLVAACRADAPPWDDDVRRDVHTLASSAWVVGDPELSRMARSIEQQAARPGPAPALDELVQVLRRWQP